MINQALNYLSTAIFNYMPCVKVSEACFYRNMDDLLHTSTSCHFKICLKSHTATLLGQRLDESLLWRFWCLRCLCRRWSQGSLYNSLTFSEEAYGFGGLLVTSLFQILDQCDLTNYAICAQIYLYLSLLGRSFSDHHLRCGRWLNLELNSKREKHSGSGKMKSRQLRMTRSVLIIAHALINIVDEIP